MTEHSLPGVPIGGVNGDGRQGFVIVKRMLPLRQEQVLSWRGAENQITGRGGRKGQVSPPCGGEESFQQRREEEPHPHLLQAGRLVEHQAQLEDEAVSKRVGDVEVQAACDEQQGGLQVQRLILAAPGTPPAVGQVQFPAIQAYPSVEAGRPGQGRLLDGERHLTLQGGHKRPKGPRLHGIQQLAAHPQRLTVPLQVRVRLPGAGEIIQHLEHRNTQVGQHLEQVLGALVSHLSGDPALIHIAGVEDPIPWQHAVLVRPLGEPAAGAQLAGRQQVHVVNAGGVLVEKVGGAPHVPGGLAGEPHHEAYGDVEARVPRIQQDLARGGGVEGLAHGLEQRIGRRIKAHAQGDAAGPAHGLEHLPGRPWLERGLGHPDQVQPAGGQAFTPAEELLWTAVDGQVAEVDAIQVVYPGQPGEVLNQLIRGVGPVGALAGLVGAKRAATQAPPRGDEGQIPAARKGGVIVQVEVVEGGHGQHLQRGGAGCLEGEIRAPGGGDHAGRRRDLFASEQRIEQGAEGDLTLADDEVVHPRLSQSFLPGWRLNGHASSDDAQVRAGLAQGLGQQDGGANILGRQGEAHHLHSRVSHRVHQQGELLGQRTLAEQVHHLRGRAPRVPCPLCLGVRLAEEAAVQVEGVHPLDIQPQVLNRRG